MQKQSKRSGERQQRSSRTLQRWPWIIFMPTLVPKLQGHHHGIMPHTDTLIIQAKVMIQDLQPEIWRRLLLPPELNLAQLHEVLQAAFGWTDSHLHEFIIGGLVYGAPEFDEDGLNTHTTFEATSVRFLDFDFYHVPKPSFLYHYDFGDSWRHHIEVEGRIPKDSSLKYPLCIAGARRAPVSIRPRPRAAAPDRACRCLRALPRQSGGLRILFTCRLPSPR